MNNQRLKLITLVGTRPEIIKLSRVIVAAEDAFEHVLVHSGQNYDYELNEIFFEQLGLPKPQHFLAAAGSTPMETIAQCLVRFDSVLVAEQPEAVLILGDTNSCLAVLAAKRRRIPIFHMEAGNRCFDDRVPEEINRRILDHTCDINLVYTEHARRYLLAEGLSADRVIKTGSPMREVLAAHRAEIAASTVLAELDLSDNEYFVVSAHREENVDDSTRLGLLLDGLKSLHSTTGLPIVFSLHPRTRQRMAALGLPTELPGIRMLKPLGFLDYIHLQQHARCVISDSGTLTEEAAILGFPAVMIRQAHERPEGMDAGVCVMSELKPERILQAVALATSSRTDVSQPGVSAISDVADYAATNVSQQVVRIIQSYTDFVYRTVWKR